MRTLLTLILTIGALNVFAQADKYPNDITVAQDGSGNYKTIQEAVNSVRDLGKRVVIHIKKGVYHEKLVVPSWKTLITLSGEDKDNTIITNSDYSGEPITSGRDMYGNTKINTFTSFTVLVQGNDFIAENLTIANESGRRGQAVALHIEADRCIIRNCRLLGNQDTLYLTTEHSRELFTDCYIEGTTDFIFGEATVVFRNCIIKSLLNSAITAAATTPRQQYGFVLMNCKLIPADTSIKKVNLGRPWRAYAKTVFLNCNLGNHISPGGWDPWNTDAMFPDKDKTAYYAEYKSTGPGASPATRVPWSHQLTDAEAKQYTIKNILGGDDNWNPLNQ